MTAAVKQLLDSFEALSNDEKVEAVAEIVRRAGHLDYPPLDDETLAQMAAERFQELDREEEADESA